MYIHSGEVSQMATARVFKSGNSQAVRLPKQFRLKTREVEISRRGDEIVLRERSGALDRAFYLLAEAPDDLETAGGREATAQQHKEASERAPSRFEPKTTT